MEYPYYDELSHAYYRMNGQIKEFEPKIITTFGAVPVTQLPRLKQKMKEKAEKSLPEPVRPKGTCPFKVNMVTATCNTECAYWNKTECALLSDNAISDLEGKCPISHRKCTEECVMRKGGTCRLLERQGV